jgi:hypothetical protein
MSWMAITGQGAGEFLTAAATWGIASFHNLFHKLRRQTETAAAPEKVSYSFNI